VPAPMRGVAARQPTDPKALGRWPPRCLPQFPRAGTCSGSCASGALVRCVDSEAIATCLCAKPSARVAPAADAESHAECGTGVTTEALVLLAFYPVFVALMVAGAFGVYVDADDAGRFEWLEPVAVRVPFATVCVVLATAASLRRIRALRSR
jgi:hypothetical protein